MIRLYGEGLPQQRLAIRQVHGDRLQRSLCEIQTTVEVVLRDADTSFAKYIQGMVRMTSTFTWLDYSEAERRKMLDVIDLFGEKTTRDELGLGGVRDAFADLLFPGTTTIQTRAKYFLLVPWTYLDLERKKVPSAKVQKRAWQEEISLVNQLADAEGVIGKRAKETLKRLASSVYWQGLKAWGILQFPGSLSEYHRSLDLFYIRQKGHAASAAEFDGEGAHDGRSANWHTGIIKPETDFPEAATMDLTFEEASYLRERVMAECSDSLLAFLLQNRVEVADAKFAWELGTALPASLAEPLKHAQNFSEVIHGSQLLYNLILAEQTAKADRIDEYRGALMQWWQTVQSRRTDLLSWDQTKFWTTVKSINPRIGGRAKAFIQAWIDLALAAENLRAITEVDRPRKLIELREFQIKGKLARTRSQRARELWSGAAGSEQLDLRWRTTRRIIADILKGLAETANA